ncbi:MAG: T9SS type A sorting domain-containing protein [Bacteroidota bacterium]
MKKQFVIFGFLVLTSISVTLLYTFGVFNQSSFTAYKQKDLTVLQSTKADEAAAWLRARYIDVETGQPITQEKLSQIQNYVRKLPKEKSMVWQEEGPDNIGGRTRAVAVNRTNNDDVWAGGVSGGLFHSSNGGDTWSRVDSYIDAGANPYISSMTMTKDGTLFVATGSNEENWGGNGVWYSEDLGLTWAKIPNTTSCTEVESGNESDFVWLATSGGLKKWKVGDASLTSLTVASGACSALKVSGNEQVIVTAFGANKTYVSTDGGNSFTDRSGTITNSLVPGNAPRIEYAISHEPNASGGYSIYAVRTNSSLLGMHVSHNSGSTWSQFVGNPGNPAPSEFDIYRDQGTYNSIVSVAPNDPEMILIGGIDVWRWKQNVNNPPSGGFNKISQWFVQPSSDIYVHADNHEMKWANNGRFYAGNDGGISISNNVDVSDPDAIEWYVANRGYNVTQFYGIAFDKFGAVMGGAQDNGTLYNDHTMNTYQEFREVNGGDGFECEISFFNERVMFSSVYYNSISRSGDKGQTWTSFEPNLPGTYDDPGTDGSPFHPFHTEFVLAEYYDENSQDSVTFIPKEDILAGDIVRVASLSSGDSMSFVASSNYYFDAELSYNPALTVNGINYGVNPATGETVSMGSDTVIYNVSWDTLRVQDPYQSWFLVYVNANGGELWGTRNALRLSVTNPQWVCVARGIGGGLFSSIDIEFSRDLEHCYVSAGTNGVWRIDGLGSVYTSDPNFVTKVAFVGSGATGTSPTYTSATKISNTGYEGIALNPNDADDLLFLPGFSGSLKRATNASTAGANGVTTTNLSSPGIACYDGIIDRENPDIIVLGTAAGVLVSTTGGLGTNAWTNSSAGFEGTAVFEVRQSWREWDEGNGRPGEIYIGTYGRGIWSSASYLGIDESEFNNSSKDKFKFTLYPNPTNLSTSISVDFDNSTNVEIEIYTINGTKVKSMDFKNLNSGKNNIDLDVQDLGKGIYVVRLVAGEKIATSKFIKL